MLDDARLFLLEGSCSCDEKASTLASVGLISPQGQGQGQGQGSSSGLHRGGLLSIYLEGVDVLLDSAIEGLTHKQNQPSLLPAGHTPPSLHSMLPVTALMSALWVPSQRSV